MIGAVTVEREPGREPCPGWSWRAGAQACWDGRFWVVHAWRPMLIPSDRRSAPLGETAAARDCAEHGALPLLPCRQFARRWCLRSGVGDSLLAVPPLASGPSPVAAATAASASSSGIGKRDTPRSTAAKASKLAWKARDRRSNSAVLGVHEQVPSGPPTWQRSYTLLCYDPRRARARAARGIASALGQRRLETSHGHKGIPMNSNFRNLAIWVVIALLLVALFNLFQNPGQSRRGNEISYSEFLAGIESGNVAEVTIAKHRISGVLPRQERHFHHRRARRPQPCRAPEQEGREDHGPAARGRRALDPGRAGQLVPHAAADRRVDLLHAPDAVGRRPRHGLRQVQGQAADRAPGPRHVRGRGRRRRGQVRSAGDRRVPARSAEVPAPRRPHPARLPAGRPARHRQDADRARRGRRGQRAVLHDLGLRLRRDVRRRRRIARARHVRAGQEERALHHLHRRDRRRRPSSRRRPRRRQRRARADAEPAARRDGRLRGQRRHHHHRRHQPARRARSGAAASRPLRPPDHGAQPGRRRPREDPAACTCARCRWRPTSIPR